MSSDFESQGLVSIREAAKWMGGLSIRTLHKHVHTGWLRTVKVGKRRLVPKQELLRVQREGLSAAKEVAQT